MKKLILLILLLISSNAYAVKCDGPNPSADPDSRVVFTWDASPSDNLDRYFVACNGTPGTDNLTSLDRVVSVSSAYTSSSAVITAFGTQYCAMTVTTADGNESDWSNEISYTCNAPAPPIVRPIAPGNFSINIEP